MRRAHRQAAWQTTAAGLQAGRQAAAKLLAVGFTRHTSGCTNSSWTSIESSTYICSSPCSEAQLELAQLRAADFQAHAQQKSATAANATQCIVTRYERLLQLQKNTGAAFETQIAFSLALNGFLQISNYILV